MRLAIVEDSAVALEAVRRAVGGAAGHAVAWVARDGCEAVRLAAADPPDLILMDLVLPGTNGAEATRRIMARSPCPVLVVTSTVSGNYALVVEALGAGAVDAVPTPTVAADGSLSGGDALLGKIAAVGRRLRGSGEQPILPPARPRDAAGGGVPVVALGASTGGPQAVAEVLREFPPGLPAAVLVAQHIDAAFAPGLADWLGQQVSLPVRLAQPGDRPEAGVVLLAGRDAHLVLTPAGRVGYTAHPANTPHRPGVDVLYGSLAANARPGAAAVLSGMGRDGAAGLALLRRAGWVTACQDEATSAVFGMPAEAARLGAAQHVLPPAAIGRLLAAHVRRVAT